MKILILAGDGIGLEVSAEVKKIIGWFNKNYSTGFEIEEDLIGGCAIDHYGEPLAERTLALARQSDAVLLGAVGGPKWDNVDNQIRPEKGLLKIRKSLGLFANLRPALVFKQLIDASSLKPELIDGLDILIVRELTGDLYFGEPRGVFEKNGEKVGINTLIYSETEITRVAKVAFEIALKRGKRLCSVDKANVLEATELWRKTVQAIGDSEYPEIELSHLYVDNAAMQLVRSPKQFDVILTTNMFGDILSDIAAMLTGSLGMLPSASFGEKGQGPALYEPVHGSAPDIAGKNIANPIAMILSFEMMLRYSFGLNDLADKLYLAVEKTLAKNYRSQDIFSAGCIKTSTSEMGDLIIRELSLL